MTTAKARTTADKALVTFETSESEAEVKSTDSPARRTVDDGGVT
jgi:hypothetical protein